MKINKNSVILVSGSIAYDRIMDFPGKFSDHILPEKIHILNVSFAINGLKESFGGTAGNIAYNLSLLGERAKILTVVGNDFTKYEKWFKKNDIDVSLVRKVRGDFTASAYIITDQSDNQIAGFYQGPLDYKYCKDIKKIVAKLARKKNSLAIISAEFKKRMVELVKIYKELKVPYVFDPGQQITSFTKDDLKISIKGAKVLIGNDYEIGLISNILRVRQKELEKMVDILVITKGEKGSEIYSGNKKIIIPPAKPKNTSDPTGAGDAYRAGFIKGLIIGWPLEKVGRLAGLVAIYTVEKYGTQTHRFSWKELTKRYRQNYREEL